MQDESLLPKTYLMISFIMYAELSLYKSKLWS